MSELDYEAILNQAKKQARAKARLLYSDNFPEQRRTAEAELTLKFYLQMTTSRTRAKEP